TDSGVIAQTATDPWITLLFDYGAEVLVDDWSRIAEEWFDAALARVEEDVDGPWLFGGLAATGWLHAHRQWRFESAGAEEPTNEREGEEADPLEQVDDILGKYLEVAPQSPELIRGLAGLGLYWLERQAHPAVTRFLEQTVEAIEIESEIHDDGITWLNRT